MAGGLVALFDDVAALAKLAAASIDDVGAAAGRASTKAAGVMIDDTAVTPAYVQGFASERELPIIKKIATGSLRNKLLFILPAALLLSEIAPTVVEIILMCGGTFLCFEGAEKVYEKLSKSHHDAEVPAAAIGKDHEQKMVSGAIRTDFILSGEIMVIALKEVIEEPLVSRGVILAVVAVFVTAVVYGLVAVIVKLDDVGLRLAGDGSDTRRSLGQALVRGTPKLLAALTTVGTAAMLWVGGHILLVGTDELGWHWPYAQVHHLEENVRDTLGGFSGDVVAWVANTGVSAIIGIIVGAAVVAVLHVLPFGPSHGADDAEVMPDGTH